MPHADIDMACQAHQQNAGGKAHRNPGAPVGAWFAQRQHHAITQQEQEGERCFDRQHHGVEIPEAGAVALAQQIGGMAFRVVTHHRADAAENLRKIANEKITDKKNMVVR